MDGGLSMGARVEITKKYATAYRKAAKKDKGQILDQACEVTGWSRDNARRRLAAAGQAGEGTGVFVGLPARGGDQVRAVREHKREAILAESR